MCDSQSQTYSYKRWSEEFLTKVRTFTGTVSDSSFCQLLHATTVNNIDTAKDLYRVVSLAMFNGRTANPYQIHNVLQSFILHLPALLKTIDFRQQSSTLLL